MYGKKIGILYMGTRYEWSWGVDKGMEEGKSENV